MINKPIKVLLIEDNPDHVHLIRSMLAEVKNTPFDVECANRLSAGIQCLAGGGFHVVLLDLSLPDSQGLDTFRKIHARVPDVPIVVMTAIDNGTAIKAVDKGAQDYLIKGQVDGDLLKRSIRYAIERNRMLGELRCRMQRDWENIFQSIGNPAMVLDPEYGVIAVNRVAEKALDKPFKELIGRKCYKIFHEKDRPHKNCPIKEMLISHHYKTIEKEIESSGNTFIVSCSPMFDEAGRLEKIIHITMNITERKQIEEQRKQGLEKLQRVLKETVHALASALGKRDPYTANHQQRVAQLAFAIGKEMLLPREQIEGIRIAAILHDIGKIYVPAEILSNPGRLTEEEFNIIKTHCRVGYDILKRIEFDSPVALVVLQHHERLNGTGYPDGIPGKEIIMEAKVLAVADVIEAISSHRPYRPALSIEKALEEISQNRGILYDPNIADAALKLFTEKGFKFE